jgi:hypothetical protein
MEAHLDKNNKLAIANKKTPILGVLTPSCQIIIIR